MEIIKVAILMFRRPKFNVRLNVCLKAIFFAVTHKVTTKIKAKMLLNKMDGGFSF